MNNIFLPTLNASLNALSFLFLILGFVFIKNNNKKAHIAFMSLALFTSTLFLGFYLYYHYTVGSVPYPHYDWTRTLYFAILIPHVILATVMVPFILALVYFAVMKNWERHVKWARLVWPVWVFVSLSGVLVYFMLYGSWISV